MDNRKIRHRIWRAHKGRKMAEAPICRRVQVGGKELEQEMDNIYEAGCNPSDGIHTKLLYSHNGSHLPRNKMRNSDYGLVGLGES